jgi:hypothetical protein
MEGAGLRIDFEAAAVPHEALGDTNLLMSVRATVTRETGSDDAAFEVRVRARPPGPHAVPWDASPETTYAEAWHQRGALRNGLLVAAMDRSASIPFGSPSRARPGRASGPGPGSLATICRGSLDRGESRAWHFLIPAYPVAVEANVLRRIEHDDVVSRARTVWRGWLSEGAVLTTPDTLVNAAWRAALVTLIQCQERYGDDWVSIGNPFQYRDVWIRDGARVVRAFAVAGLTGRARANAWALRHFQLPLGALISQRGQLDGTGQALWAFEQAASLPPDDETAKRFLPIAERGFRWIETQREVTRQFGMRWGDLLPFGDPRDAELVRAQLTGNDAWAIAGCRAVVTLARHAGNDALAREAFAAYQDYRTTFARALQRTQREDVPPSWQEVGRDWGNASAGYPTAALPANHARLVLTARRMWAQSPTAALVSYGHRDSVHTYLGADLAQWALLDERPAMARRYVSDLLAHSSSTLGQAEIFDRAGGRFGNNLPPHTTAAATLVDLLRNMVVSDAGDTLDLALGGDLDWWSGTEFKRAPTRFGVVDVALSRQEDVLEATWSTAAAAVRIRVPDGAVASQSLIPGIQVHDARWIVCPPGMTRAAFRIRVIE